MFIDEGDNRIIVGEIVMEGKFKLHARPIDGTTEELILGSIVDRYKDFCTLWHRLTSAIEYVDRYETGSWIDSRFDENWFCCGLCSCH